MPLFRLTPSTPQPTSLRRTGQAARFATVFVATLSLMACSKAASREAPPIDTVTSALAELAANTALQAGQSLVSPNGGFIATMQADGEFVAQKVSTGQVRFRTAVVASQNNAGWRLRMRASGALVVLDANDNVRWTSASQSDEGWTPSLRLDDNGELTVTAVEVATGATKHLWRSSTLLPGQTLRIGQFLTSPNGSYAAFLDPETNSLRVAPTNLRYVPDGQPLSDDAVTTAELTDAGELVVKDKVGKIVARGGGAAPQTNGPRHLFLGNLGALNLRLGSVASPGETVWKLAFGQQYAMMSDTTLAYRFRPQLRFRGDHTCFPLTMKEAASIEEYQNGFEDHCRASYAPDFVVVAAVTHMPENPESFRIGYGVPFGWQMGFPFSDALQGAHGADAQYIVVDVVNGQLTAAWADLHKGSYARSRQSLTLVNGTHVVAWAGQGYNSVKLTSDVTTACRHDDIDPRMGLGPKLAAVCTPSCVLSNECPQSVLTNWGDPVGDTTSGDGTLVMARQACQSWSAGKAYTSMGTGATFSGSSLTRVSNYIGCGGAPEPWLNGDAIFFKKDAGGNTYEMNGAKEGDTEGGRVLAGSEFPENTPWLTSKPSYRNTVLSPITSGRADPDYWAGNIFNDLRYLDSALASFRIRTGERVLGIETTYADGKKFLHGALTEGYEKVLGGLVEDPIEAITICEGEHDDMVRIGHIAVTTMNGRTMSGGNSLNNCRTTKMSGKVLLGFFGRSDERLFLLGTFWGDAFE